MKGSRVQKKPSGLARWAGRTTAHVHEATSPTTCAHTKFQSGLGKAPGVTEESPKSSPRTDSPCTPSHPKTSLPPATGPPYRKWDLFTKLALKGLLLQTLFTLDFKEQKELEVKYSKGKTHGKGEFSSPGKMNFAGVNKKQIV